MNLQRQVEMIWDDGAEWRLTLREWAEANAEDEVCTEALPLLLDGKTITFSGGGFPLCRVRLAT